MYAPESGSCFVRVRSSNGWPRGACSGRLPSAPTEDQPPEARPVISLGVLGVLARP